MTRRRRNPDDPGTRPIVEALRRVIRRNAPDAVETTCWGALSYHRPWIGGRVKGSVCQIVLRDGGVRLDFVHGTSLPDPARLLQGERVAKRFVPVPTVASARRPQIASLIRSAADFVPGRPG